MLVRGVDPISALETLGLCCLALQWNDFSMFELLVWLRCVNACMGGPIGIPLCALCLMPRSAVASLSSQCACGWKPRDERYKNSFMYAHKISFPVQFLIASMRIALES